MVKLSRVEEKIVLYVIIAVLCIVGVYKFIVLKPDSIEVIKDDSLTKETEDLKESKAVKETVDIYVYITGEVNKPGLYVLKLGDRIVDAVNSAGGFTNEADTTCINLAEKLRDEDFINIVKRNEDINRDSNSRSAVNGGKININIATAKEIDEFLPGIGEVYANNIINYRNKNGRFKSIDEITRVEGVGSGKRFEKIKDLITVN